MEVSGQLDAPAVLPPGKELLIPIGYETGWGPETVWMQWQRQKIPSLSLSGNESIIQPAA